MTTAARLLSIRSIEMLAEIMQDRRAQAVARVRAVEILLERGYGKAPQKIVVETDIGVMENSALRSFLLTRVQELARTIEGQADRVEDDGEG